MKQQKPAFGGVGTKNRWIAPAIGTGLFLIVSAVWIFGLISLALLYARIPSPELQVAIALLVHLAMTGAVIGGVYRLLGIAHPFQSAIIGVVIGMLGYAGVTVLLNANNVLDGVIGTLLVSFSVTIILVFLSLLIAINLLRKVKASSQSWAFAGGAVIVYAVVLLLAGTSI